MALLLQEIVDEHIPPDKLNEPAVSEARDLLAAYWTSRDATLKDACNREPAWIKDLKRPALK